MNATKKKDLTPLFCLITAFVTLLFTSRSSFLFITNDWDDVNSYFTIGKGMMNGLVVYRDLYDQKGPYLYLLNAIAYLISHKSFLGIFIFEVIAATASLFLIYRTAILFCEKRSALLLIPLASAGIYSSFSFYKGGAAEEYCLPFLIYSLYVLLEISGITELPDKKALDKKVFIIGIFAGIITQIKYTMLGFYMGFAIAAVLFLIIAGKKIREIFGFIFWFLLAFVITFIPWLIYFGVNDALDDWYRCYVYNNIFFYSAISDNTANMAGRLYTLAKFGYWLMIDNWTYFVFVIIGFLGLLFSKGNIVNKLFAPFIFFTTFFVIFFGGNTLPYYSIPLMAFASIGVGFAGKIVDFVLRPKDTLTFKVAVGAFMVLSVMGASRHCISYDYLHMSPDDFWLMDFKEIVEQEEEPTLLNIGGLDAGLYTVTGIVPTCEYFQTNGIGLPTMFEEQKEYIKSGKTTFILVHEYLFDNLDIHYDRVAEAEYDGVHFYLYKKVR